MNAICGAGQDTWNLRHKSDSQGPALRILGPRVAISNSQESLSRILVVKVPCPRVLILDYAHLYYRLTLYLIVTSFLNVSDFLK